jgi:hypothetical protein
LVADSLATAARADAFSRQDVERYIEVIAARRSRHMALIITWQIRHTKVDHRATLVPP